MTELSPSHYRTAFEYASDAIFLHDPDDGHIIEANQTSERLTGFSRAELLNQTVAAISPPRPAFSIEEAQRRIRRATEEGGYTFEWVCIHRSGGEYPVEVNLKLITVEGRRLVLALFRDIRERKLYEDRLIAREAHFRRLIQHSSDGIAIVNHNGRLRYVSPSISTVLGYDERRATGRNVLHYIHPEDIDRLRQLLRREATGCGEAEVAHHVTYRILHRDGHWRHHEATCKNLLAAPDIQGVLINYRDVTERIEAELRARERERELEHVARCRSMGELASALAHELNQPFAAIGNYVGGCIHRLESGRFDRDETLDALRLASAQADRAGRIMVSMRNFTRRSDPTRAMADVNAMVRDVAPFIDLKAAREGVRVVYRLSPRPLETLADPILIAQVILNIAFNGIEAMAETPAERRSLVIATDHLPRAVRISIEDRGHGLPKMNPDKIFDAFYTTKKQGLGIGLTLCRTIVDSHQGHMWVTSGNGGTLFHVALPVGTPEEGTA
ncbi:PAS domain S-box protein [Zavarzinia aquatilis]|nr:PAS domain S-box protein [Zavarzinia aquatilis]